MKSRSIGRRRAPSAYGCLAVIGSLVVPAAAVSALYGLAQAIAQTWNPFL